MMVVLAGILGLLALGVGGITVALAGTIILTNAAGMNYETAGKYSFFAGLVACAFILSLNAATIGTFIAASLWMTGLGVAIVAGYFFGIRLLGSPSKSDSN